MSDDGAVAAVIKQSTDVALGREAEGDDGEAAIDERGAPSLVSALLEPLTCLLLLDATSKALGELMDAQCALRVHYQTAQLPAALRLLGAAPRSAARPTPRRAALRPAAPRCSEEE